MEWIKDGKVVCPKCGSDEVYRNEVCVVVHKLTVSNKEIFLGDHEIYDDYHSPLGEATVSCADCDYEMSDEDMDRYDI